MLDAARAVVPAIRDARAAIERDGALPHALLAQLREAQLFELWLPASLGGPELHPAAFVEVIEALASADGSAGWCAGVAGTLSLLGASLRPAVAREVFANHGVLAGAFRPKGRAVPVDGGYRVTGRWEYGSGVLHADWVAVHCLVGDQMRFVVVPTREIEVLRTWDVSGMRGTGSHDFRIDDVFVPAERTIAPFASEPLEPGPLYRIGLLILSTTSLAAVTLGIARAAIDALIALAAKTPTGTSTALRDQPRAQFAAGRAEALVRAARAGLFAALDHAWNDAAAGKAPTVAGGTTLRLACAFAAEASAGAVDLVYTAAGGTAIYESGPIARAFRDVHAATQHIGLASANYEAAGKVLFGGDAGSAF